MPVVISLWAVLCHAAPSPVQPQARQSTTLFVDCYGESDTTPAYTVDVFLPTEENFYNFNISKFSSSSPNELLALPFRTLTLASIASLTTAILTSLAANPASVSRICVGGPGACGIYGADGSSTQVNGGYCADVGPPQPQVSGICTTF